MAFNYGQKLRESRNQSGAQETNALLVPAPNNNRSVAVAYIFVMADTAMTISFYSGTSTLEFQLYPAARGGATPVAPLGEFLFECQPGEALTYSTSVAGSHYVHVLYGEV